MHKKYLDEFRLQRVEIGAVNVTSILTGDYATTHVSGVLLAWQ
jgi:hypothetical protein